MTEVFDYGQLEGLLRELDPSASDCREKLARMRLLMDQSCAMRIITVSQWRSLLERVAILKAK